MNYSKLICNKKILITGGAGFIGSHLAKRLHEYGNDVYVLDNYFTGDKKNHHKGITYKKGDTAKINNYFRSFPIDYIYHLGEYSRVEQSYHDIDLVIKYNTHPLFNVLKLASYHNAKIIYSGSSTKFSYNRNTVESPYSLSKRHNTEFLVNYASWYGIKYAITYFYNVYGPNEISKGSYATLIGKFLSLKKQNANFLPITKPGTQKRVFTHVDDIVNGLILVGKKGTGDGFGIGANKSYSILDVAKMLDMPYKLNPEKKGNRLNSTLKTSRTKRLGWRPKKNLKTFIFDEIKK